MLMNICQEVTAMNAILKPVAGAKTSERTIVTRNGKVLEARYSTNQQAKNAAAVIAKRREALVYLSKR